VIYDYPYTPADDVIAQLETRLVDARAAAACAVDRAKALEEMRSKVLEIAHRLERTTLTPDEMWSAVDDEYERAELTAIVDRAFPEPKE
jgi:hypothetical protein